MIRAIYAPFLRRHRRHAHFRCLIEAAKPNGRFVYRRGHVRRTVRSLADLLFLLDKDLTISLQRQRRDLYFVHAGVVGFRGSAVAFVAPSGTGKSTTVWALLKAKFKYVSDELLPVEIPNGRVWPYPRALCLKESPPAPYTLPATAVDLETRHYVPAGMHQTVSPRQPIPLRAIFFLESAMRRAGVRAAPIVTAEAAARLYANALNPLAHPRLGLDAALTLVRRVQCYRLQLGGMPETVAAVRRMLRASPF